MSTTLSSAYLTTTSSVLNKDLHTPFSGGPALKKVKGFLTKILDEQQVAASATTRHVVRTAGTVSRVLAGVATLAAAGESMTIDIQKNGTSILTSPTLAVAHTTTPIGLFDVTPLIIAGTSVAVGDVIEIVRTLTAGSTLTETDVSLEIS